MSSWNAYFVTQADYQIWANEVMFTALDQLPAEAIAAEQGLFFGSIHHTVDHILMVSRLWFARLMGSNLSVNFKVIHHPDWAQLKDTLRHESGALKDWIEARPESFFSDSVSFVGSDGVSRTMAVQDILVHLFTHYAHHRGQVSAVVTRLNAPCPEMDFYYYRRANPR